MSLRKNRLTKVLGLMFRSVQQDVVAVAMRLPREVRQADAVPAGLRADLGLGSLESLAAGKEAA